MRHHSYGRLAVIALALAALAFPAGALAGQAKGTIKVASQSPLSGEQAALGEGIKLGAQLAVEKFKGPVEKLGFKVEFVPFDDQAKPDVGVANAKSIVADGRWVRIGSTNMNVSSLVANYELDVMIDDQEFANQMEAQFRRDLDQSVEVWLKPARRFGDTLDFRLEASPGPRVRGLRERRRRTVIALRAVVGGSQRALLLQQTLGLMLLAGLLLFFPVPMAIVFGVLTLYFAFTGMLETLERRRTARRTDGLTD